jgi:hypothetical protein
MEHMLYNEQWDHYRLGDVVSCNGGDFNLYHLKQYPTSIASEYIKRTDKAHQHHIVEDIIKEKKFESYDIELLLHIRIGDVLCKQGEIVDYDKTPKRYYSDYYAKFNNKDWWYDILQYIRQHNIKHIVIMAGAHFKECLSKSAQYINNRKDFIIENIPDVTIEYALGISPDDGVVLAYNAKHCISTGGEYGKLLTAMNRLHNNSVYH